MIELKAISKRFPVRGIVLDNLDFRAEAGSTTAILGPSGSGKTTLLNIIGMLEHADKGAIIFDGTDITALTAEESAHHRNSNIGFIFQDNLLLPHLTVMQNIMLPLLATKSNSGNTGFSEEEEYARSLAEKTGITGILEKYPFHISGGEAQRASFVRALINKPKLLLADEPTGSLDRKNAEILTSLLLELGRSTGTTLITVTHSDALASAMTNRLEITDGRLFKL